MKLEPFQQQQINFAAHIRDPENVAAPTDIDSSRMEVYRDLFFNNIVNFLKGSYPVLYKVLGNERWKMLVRDFYRDHASHTPLFPQLAGEFLQYLMKERAEGKQTDPAGDPPFLAELAHYEWVEIGLRFARDPKIDKLLRPEGDLLSERPVTSPLAWLLTYHYPVDKIGESFQPDKPEEQPKHYLVLRNNEMKIKFISLNLVSARLFELLRDNPEKTGNDNLLSIAKEMNHKNPEAIVRNGQTIMQQWLEKNALLGTLPAI